MELSSIDQLFLLSVALDRFSDWLPIEGLARLDLRRSCVEIEVRKAEDVDLLRSIAPVAIRQARLLVGCDRVEVWFAGDRICNLGERVESKEKSFEEMNMTLTESPIEQGSDAIESGRAVLTQMQQSIDSVAALNKVFDDLAAFLRDRVGDMPGTYRATPPTAEEQAIDTPLLEVTSELAEAASDQAENSAAAPEISLRLPQDIRRTITKTSVKRNLQLALPKARTEQIAYLDAIANETESGKAWLDRLLTTIVAVHGGDRPSLTSYRNAARRLLDELKPTGTTKTAEAA